MTGKSRIFGGVLLVSGTTIGAAMLALPISTGMAGFFPSIVVMILAWVLMSFTALLMLEVNMWMHGDVNIITMAKATLGRAGEMYSWIAYLFLLYALTTAYIAGSGPLFLTIFESMSGQQHLPYWLGTLPLLAIFGVFVYKGTAYVDYINRILMLGLVVTYILLVVLVTPNIDPTLLVHHNVHYLTLATSVIVTSFGFHIIIPSLATYMRHNVKEMRLAIVIGSSIPLIVYIIWELMTLGVVPVEGPQGLLQAFKAGSNGADVLAVILRNSWISVVARCFLFFAIVTSFLGVSLSLRDFLADGLKIKKSRRGRLILCALAFIPPLAISLSYPRAFLTALEYAGAYGVVTLLGLLPALMVWRGRYHKKMVSHYQAPGGKMALILVIIASLVVIVLETGSKFGWFHDISF